MTSRVRCSCGRVYDPQKHSQCPDCGAESAVESVVVAEKIKPPAPPEPGHESPATEKDRVPSMRRTLPWPVFAGAAVLLIGIVFFALHHPVPPPPNPPNPNPVQVSPVPHEESSPNPSPSESTSAYSPSGSPSSPIVLGGGGNLSELIAGVGQGGTLKLRPGIYQGGVVVNRPVRIIAETQGAGNQVVIQTEGKECLSVRAKGVAVQNIQFWCKGIGDLPAISVADGAELEMEGCKIQSGSGLGLSVGNASIKTLGSSFTTPNGIAVLVNGQAHASFTQSSFSQSQIGLGVQSGATAELHSCAFEGIGMGDKDGAIIVAAGENTQVTGTDCHFTNNTVGMGAREKASLSLTTCTFKGNALDSRSSGLVVLRDAQVAVRKTALVDASPYALNVMSNGALTLEDAEISGSRGAGLVVGERNASPARAEIKRSRFYRNAIAIGVVAGSSAEIEDSDCRENKEGILVLEQGSRLKLKKTTILYNREHGLHVYANAEATVTDSEIRNNGRGAQSGVPHKPAQRGSLTLEDCRIGGNQVFGVGACVQSQLTLTRCVFDEESKKNIYRESGAIVQSDTGSELTPSPQEAAEATPSPESTAKTKSSSRRTTRTRQRQQDEDAARDISRIIRQWVPHP